MKHIVLIGLNFFLKKHKGDKNFWIELLPFLAIDLKKITILSVRDNSIPIEKYNINDCKIVVKYFSPRILDIGERKKKKLIRRKGAFPSVWGSLEKLLNARRISKELKQLYTVEPYDYIHLMDNMGITNRIISSNALAGVSVSAMAYQGKNRFIYDKYLLLSYKHPNLIVVPYSQAYEQKMKSIGIDRDRIICIPWGVKVDEKKSEKEKKKSKSTLLLPINKPLILWAGYIQQIRRKDFMLAFESAKKALEEGLNANFFFAFKSKIEGFECLHEPEKGIFIKTTTVKEFSLLKKATDVFYSPVYNKNVILAPPLTWIEVMSEGVPIVTTDVGGVDEIVEDGKTGFVAKNEKDVVKKLIDVSQCYYGMRENCYRKVQEKFDIKKIAKKYLRLWGIGYYGGI